MLILPDCGKVQKYNYILFSKHIHAYLPKNINIQQRYIDHVNGCIIVLAVTYALKSFLRSMYKNNNEVTLNVARKKCNLGLVLKLKALL